MIYKAKDWSMQFLWEYLNESVDVAGITDEKMLCQWVSEVEQTVYNNIVEEISETYLTRDSDYCPGTYELPFTPDKITKVFVDGVEFERGSQDTLIDENVYIPVEGGIRLKPNMPEQYSKIDIYYRLTPSIKHCTRDMDDDFFFVPNDIYLPDEWIKIVIAYCKGMIYKEVNEFTLANNHLQEYNAYLEDFAAYIQSKDTTVY